MELEPRFEQRRVEALAVEADQRARATQFRGYRLKQKRLVLEAHEQPLARRERSVSREPSATDQKHVRPCAAVQAGGLEINEHERRVRRARKQRHRARRPIQRLGKGANGLAAAGVPRLHLPLDDEAAVLPCATKRREVRRFRIGSRRGRLGLDPAILSCRRDDAANAVGEGAQNGCISQPAGPAVVASFSVVSAPGSRRSPRRGRCSPSGPASCWRCVRQSR